jgi:hypothetical protein
VGSLRRGALLWDHCVAWHIQMEVDFGGSETIESWRDDPTGLRSWLGEGGKKVTIPGYPGTLNGLTGRQDSGSAPRLCRSSWLENRGLTGSNDSV